MLYPLGSLIQNAGHIAKVIGYRNSFLIVEGVGASADIGRWLAALDNTIRLSDGHFGFAGKYEYFIFKDDLYRAPAVNPVGLNGLRQGARALMAKHLLDAEYLESLGLVPQTLI